VTRLPSLAVAGCAALGAGGLFAAMWVLLASLANTQALVLAVGVGLTAGYVCSWVARRGGVAVGVVSFCVTAAVLLVSLFYVNRLAFIQAEAEAGRRLSVPLRAPPTWFWHVLDAAFRRWIMHIPYVIGALGSAAWCGYHGVGALHWKAVPVHVVSLDELPAER
jgi:hypothetical protein